MAIRLIDLGTPNGKNGDIIRDAFQKVNQNFVEISALLGEETEGLDQIVRDTVAPMFVHQQHQGVTATYLNEQGIIKLIAEGGIGEGDLDGGLASTIFDEDLTVDGGGA